MAFINWSDEFSVNHESFDYQHKRLVSLMNKLYDLFKSGKDTPELLVVFDSFVDFVIEHFGSEELVMEKFNFPDLEDHKVEHKVLIHVLKKYQLQIKQKGFSVELMDVLKHWLLDHIMKLDKKYGAYLQHSGVS